MAQKNFNDFSVYRARIRTHVFLKIVIAVHGKISSRAEKDVGKEVMTGESVRTNAMLMDTEDDRETDEPAEYADMLWQEDKGDYEPDIDDSYLSHSVSTYEGREGSCLHRIV